MMQMNPSKPHRYPRHIVAMRYISAAGSLSLRMLLIRSSVSFRGVVPVRGGMWSGDAATQCDGFSGLLLTQWRSRYF
jgi:hypothetical protein